jgi:hypothetical protein
MADISLFFLKVSLTFQGQQFEPRKETPFWAGVEGQKTEPNKNILLVQVAICVQPQKTRSFHVLLERCDITLTLGNFWQSVMISTAPPVGLCRTLQIDDEMENIWIRRTAEKNAATVSAKFITTATDSRNYIVSYLHHICPLYMLAVGKVKRKLANQFNTLESWLFEVVEAHSGVVEAHLGVKGSA